MRTPADIIPQHPPDPGSASEPGDRGRVPSFHERYRRRRGSISIALNLTPMIDVVFLLLFFFLVASRFGVEGMLPARLPARAAGASAEVPRTPLRVRFSLDRGAAEGFAVTIDHFHPAGLPIASLMSRLESIRSDQPGFDGETPVHLIAPDEVPWDGVVNAYNAALAAGYHKVFFVDPQ
jgi:biopolymer transport protein ExbD